MDESALAEHAATVEADKYPSGNRTAYSKLDLQLIKRLASYEVSLLQDQPQLFHGIESAAEDSSGASRSDALAAFLTPMTWRAEPSYEALAAPPGVYVASSTGMLTDADLDLGLYAGGAAAVATFEERVDQLCEEVAAIERLMKTCTEDDDISPLKNAAELAKRVGETALGAPPAPTNTDAGRAKRREARHARLDAARARRIASEERRDALKAELESSSFTWKLAIRPTEGPLPWSVRISEGFNTAPAAGKKPEPQLEPAERPVMSQEHNAALSARVHEEELLRAAMAAERTANQKERQAIELERQAMVQERAVQHEVEVHARLLAEERVKVDEAAAEERAKEEAAFQAAEVAALEAAELQSGMAREHRLKMLKEQHAREETARLARLEETQVQHEKATAAAHEALARKKKNAMATLAAVDALSKAHDKSEKQRIESEAAARTKVIAEHAAEVERIQREHDEAAEVAAKQRAATAASTILRAEQVERARQRESERRVREERWAADRKARVLLEKQASAERLARDTAVRQSALQKLRDAESRVMRAQEEARLVAAQAEKGELERVKKQARAAASERAQELLSLQAARTAGDTRRVEQEDAMRRATLLLSDTSWSGGGSGAGTGSVARWNSTDVLEWFTKSFRWAGESNNSFATHALSPLAACLLTGMLICWCTRPLQRAPGCRGHRWGDASGDG